MNTLPIPLREDTLNVSKVLLEVSELMMQFYSKMWEIPLSFSSIQYVFEGCRQAEGCWMWIWILKELLCIFQVHSSIQKDRGCWNFIWSHLCADATRRRRRGQQSVWPLPSLISILPVSFSLLFTRLSLLESGADVRRNNTGSWWSMQPYCRIIWQNWSWKSLSALTMAKMDVPEALPISAIGPDRSPWHSLLSGSVQPISVLLIVALRKVGYMMTLKASNCNTEV